MQTIVLLYCTYMASISSIFCVSDIYLLLILFTPFSLLLTKYDEC